VIALASWHTGGTCHYSRAPGGDWSTPNNCDCRAFVGFGEGVATAPVVLAVFVDPCDLHVARLQANGAEAFEGLPPYYRTRCRARSSSRSRLASGSS